MTSRIGPLVATLSLAVVAVTVGTQMVSGAPDGTETVFVPTTPCRLVDTRPNTVAKPTLNVGPRATKLGADEAATFNAFATGDGNSPCEVPVTATAIATNVVAVAPTAGSFMTLYPADVENPGTANLNYVGGQAPTPNSANIPLAADGGFTVFNAFGEVHVVIDVNGYFQPSSAVGSQGPAGPTGPAGPAGPSGAELFDRTIVVNSGGTTAENGARLVAAVDEANSAGANASNPWLIKIEPGIFDVGSSQLRPQSYVSIEGSGIGITTVRGEVRANSTESAAIIVLRRATVSDLTIINTGGGGDGNFAVGIFANSGVASSVRIEASGTLAPYGVNFGLDATFDLVDSVIEATGTGRPVGVGNAASSNTNSVIRIIRSTISATSTSVAPSEVGTGTSSTNGTLVIDQSAITAGVPVNVGASAGKTLQLEIDHSRLTATRPTGARTITVFSLGTSNAELRYVELSHVTDLDEATTTDCVATIAPVGFLEFGCPI